MAVSIKRVLVGCSSIIAMGLALLVAVLLWMGWKGRAARHRAEHLCAGFSAGADAEPFARRANELGLQTMPAMPRNDDPRGDVTVQMAYDAIMLARWSCTVEVAGGRVLTAKVDFVD